MAIEWGIRSRRIEELLDTLVMEEPVTAIHGPRSVGKSTLLRRFADRHGVAVIDLDDPLVRDAMAANPSSAVGGETPVCVDEYQHVPELLDALKARLNREGSMPGVAVLTGSTRQDALPRTAQSLTGRLHNLVILPLSQGEIAGVREDLLPSLREEPEGTVAQLLTSTTTRAEYIERVCAGGFPLALIRGEVARNRWFDDYVRSCIERDAAELMKVQQRQVLGDLFRRLAGRTAQILNVASVSDGLQVDRKTIDGYIRLLEDLYLVVRLPAWGKTLTARATSTPKVHVVDSGLAARLQRLNPVALQSLDPTMLTEFGHLLETFVVGELRKQASWLEGIANLGHWRTGDGDEIDLVVEFDDGLVLAFEVKAGERISSGDFRGLRKLREALGDRFVAGVVFSTGIRSYSYENRLHVLPIDRLWRTNG